MVAQAASNASRRARVGLVEQRRQLVRAQEWRLRNARAKPLEMLIAQLWARALAVEILVRDAVSGRPMASKRSPMASKSCWASQSSSSSGPTSQLQHDAPLDVCHEGNELGHGGRSGVQEHRPSVAALVRPENPRLIGDTR
jgi:hypothetical protein